LRHLPRRSLDLLDVYTALNRTHPENIFPGDRLHRLVRPPHCLIDSPSRSGWITSETRRNVQNHTDVAIDLLLVSNDFVWSYSYLAILKNLIGARIRSNTSAEPRVLWTSAGSGLRSPLFKRYALVIRAPIPASSKNFASRVWWYGSRTGNMCGVLKVPLLVLMVPTRPKRSFERT